jgi:hypothetical protein
MTSIQEEIPAGPRAEIREIASRINDDARMRLVTMKPGYDTIDLGEALIGRLLLAERNRAIEECRRAIRDTLNPDNYERSNEFILMGPAGIIRRADAAIRALLK